MPLARLALLLLWPCAAEGAQEPARTVVGLYHFDEGKGKWAYDASEAENHGMLGRSLRPGTTTPRWAAKGRAGGALEFDGHDDVVTIPHRASLMLRRGIEVEAWVHQKKRTPYARVLDKGSCFELYIREDGIPTFRYRGAEAHGVRGQQPVPLNEWVHLKATHDGRTMRLLVNGAEAGSRPYADPIPSKPLESSSDLRIGNGRFARPFCGLIDEVKVVNIGYVPPVVKAFESDDDTVGLWHLDDGSARDAGPSGLHGEIHGARAERGRLGGALRFGGKAHVRIPHHPSLDLQEELTIDCWVKQLERSPYGRIVEKDNWVYGLWITDRGLADFFYKTPAGITSHTLSEAELPLNRWVHIRAEFDGSETVVTFDGSEVARNAVPEHKQTIARSDGDLFLGNRQGGDRGFIGLLDEVRVSRTVRRPRAPVDVRIVAYPSKGIWVLRVNARGARGHAASVRGTIVAKDTQRKVQGFSIPELKRGLGRAEVDASAIQPGDYVVAVTALDAEGRNVAEAKAPFRKPPKPAWLGANLGVSDEVLPPWTPLRAERGEDGVVHVSCWGRRHSFAGLPLPRQVRSGGADLLAEPMRLVVRSRGAELEQADAAGPAARAEKHQVLLAGSARAGAIDAALEVTMEYDGMARFDLTLSPTKRLEVDSACLEIPLAARHATLMHHPGRWFRDPTCAGALPKEGWRAPSAWYLWLGDEARGLCWFAEDQAAWGLDPKRPGIEAVRDGEVVRLRVWLINAKTTLTEPRAFTWGLMATPVKPRPKGWQRWRFGSPGGPVTIGVRWSTLQSSRWHSFPVPPDPEAYRADVRKTHEQGKKFIPYTNFNMQSDTGDEWAYWGEEWRGYAGEGKAADVLAMNVVNVRCCAMTPTWCDFIVWKYKTFLEAYDSDGFYLDNSIPAACRNPAHPKAHHSRRHLFAARALMKRLYTVTRHNDPDNVMVCHMSSRLCIPLLSFCDAIVDGEQYGWALRDDFDGHYMPLTPLDRVRAELMGWQWGLVPFFLPCNRGPNPWTPKLMRELLALMLPHGMRFWLAGHRQTMTKVLDAVDAFGLEGARFVPYWSVPQWRRMADEQGLAMSAYVRGGSAMLLVANLREPPRDVSLKLEPHTLGLAQPPRQADDPLDGLPVALVEGELRLRVDGRDLRIVVLSRDGAP